MQSGPLSSECLRSLQGYDDPNGRFRERFLTPEIGGGRTVAVLSTPLSTPLPTGWVICSSFGIEQADLMPLEVALARELAAAGFSVLRFHPQGYGDSASDEVSAGAYVREAMDAVRILLEAADVRTTGLVGARFGGTVAALAADRQAGAAMVLVDPVTKGQRYIESLVSQDRMAALVHGGRARTPQLQTGRGFEGGRVVEVGSFSVPREVIEEISSLDLISDVATFTGRSAIVQVSRSSVLKGELDRLVQRLRELGGQCAVEIVVHANAAKLALPPNPRDRDGRNAREDLLRTVVSRTVAVCSGLAESPVRTGP